MNENWNFKPTVKRGWSTGEKHNCASACSWAEEHQQDSSLTILISRPVEAAIMTLCKKIKDEWQMLLLGEEVEGGLLITDYYIPKQQVTAASVKNLDCIDAAFIRDRGVVATIHSHSNMAVFFSSTDDEYTNNSLIKNHIVVNNRYETTAVMRRALPCGMVKFVKAKVDFESTPEADSKDISNIELLPIQSSWKEDREKWEHEYDSYEGYGGNDMYGGKLVNSQAEKPASAWLRTFDKKKSKKFAKKLKGGIA